MPSLTLRLRWSKTNKEIAYLKRWLVVYNKQKRRYVIANFHRHCLRPFPLVLDINACLHFLGEKVVEETHQV